MEFEEMKGIDVAKWNEITDYGILKSQGVEFAIVKVINKSNKADDRFHTHMCGFEKANIPVIGGYNYSYATTTDKAIQDAYAFILASDGKIKTCWLDVEDNCQKNIGSKLIDIILAYKQVIEKAGLEFGVYTGMSFYNSYLKPYASKIDFPIWIARYYKGNTAMRISENPLESKKPNIGKNIYAWQYTSKGLINGIKGYVDMNYLYSDLAPKSKPQSLADTLELLQGVQTYSLSKDGNKTITINGKKTNFKVKEFACKDGSDSILIDKTLVIYLQNIRDHFGKPVLINSAYRTPTYNVKIGGAKNSYHMKGQASDTKISGVNPPDVCKYAESIGIKGIGQYGTFTHIDTRTARSYWKDSEQKKITCFITLKLGDSGEYVKLLQKKLNIPQTGIFDKTTQGHVVVFQSQNGLKPDGVVGRNTWDKLNI